ncbi:hypothetical protein [Hymenobacter daeguensis]
MKIAALGLAALAMAFVQLVPAARAQTAPPLPKKLPPAVPGRIHLLSGSTLAVPLVYLDYNKIVAVDKEARKVYTPLEVSSFVMQQDSFIVLKDFKVAVGEDEQEYRIAFVRVGVVGPGFALYHFTGTMRRDDAVHYDGARAFTGSGWVGGAYKSQVTEYEMSRVWFVKRDDDPHWLSLPKSGSRIRTIVEPIIADDKKLVKSVSWAFITAEKVQKVLAEYVADKKAGLN